MTALLVTLALFVPAGAAAAAVLRLTPAGTVAGRLGFWYLAGVAALGMALYMCGLAGVPITRPTLAALIILSLVLIALNRARLRNSTPVRHHRLATVIVGLPLTAMLLITSVLPVLDYDGRVTWLPKARAIALDGSIQGPFFHGKAGLNLHNEYPLLMPLNAAAVLIVTGRMDIETVRWLYALVAVAALLAVRDLIAVSQPRSAAWAIAVCAWLPILLAIDGGALSAYNDVTVMAMTGLAVVLMHTPEFGSAGVRAAALFLSALVLLKNEGVVIMFAVLCAAAIARRLRTTRDVITVLLPVISSVVVLLEWRRRVPAAYDEQYDVLIRTLPGAVHRLPAAIHVLAMHSLDAMSWGWFWPVTVAATFIALMGRRRTRAVGPLLMLLLTLSVYCITFSVTSWNIAELAQVAASRLLLHLIIPAIFVIAIAGEAFCDWLQPRLGRS